MNISRTKGFLLVLLILGLVVVVGLGIYLKIFSQGASETVSSKVKIVASFYPLADVAKQVGQDLVEVTNITPTGGEPHDYEPTPQDVVNLYQARLLLLNGNGVDAWGDKLISDLHAQGVKVLRMSDSIGGADPHIWLDPTNVEKEADLVAAALAELDPTHALTYFAQRDVYKARLEALDQAYRTGLAHCPAREIVTTHDAFGYLARRYDLTTLHLLGLSPEEDPSPARLAEVASLAKQKKIKTIFFETLVSPKLANTIAREIGAKTLVLNPVEGLTEAEAREGKDYIQIMQENLQNIRQALACTN